MIVRKKEAKKLLFYISLDIITDFPDKLNRTLKV